jgi:hypothetical protein
MSQFRKCVASSNEWATHSTKRKQYKLIGGNWLILSILPLNRRSSEYRELDDLVGHMVKSNAVGSLPKFVSTSTLGNPIFFERSTLVKGIIFIPWWAYCEMVALLWNSSELITIIYACSLLIPRDNSFPILQMEYQYLWIFSDLASHHVGSALITIIRLLRMFFVFSL